MSITDQSRESKLKLSKLIQKFKKILKIKYNKLNKIIIDFNCDNFYSTSENFNIFCSDINYNLFYYKL